jgi:tetratricopeptide (TPR) repeat protein
MLDSVSLLQKYVPDSSQAEAEAIAAELGNLPLALHLAGSFLERYQGVVSPEDYFDQLKKQGLKHPSLTGRGIQYSPTEHELNVARTFALSHEKLDAANEVDAIALALLTRAACFAPGEPVPRELLFDTLSFDKNDLEASLLVEDGLVRLQDLGLAMLTENGSLWLHRLVAKFVQQASIETNAQDDVEVTLLQKAKRLNQRIMPAAFKDWQSHLRYVASQAQDRNSEKAADLSHELGNYLRIAGNYEEAYIWLERAWQIRRHRLGPEHLETARSLNDMGIVQAEMGQFDEAISTVQKALEIRQQHAAIHADTAESYNNLGHILQSLSDLEGARQYLEQALAIYDQLPDLVPPEKAQSLNNLGVVLFKLGELDKSQANYEQAKNIWQNYLEPNHPYFAHVMINLGTIAWSSGDLPQAKQYFEQGVDVLKASLGERHPLTATAYNNLGATLRELGNFEEAQSNMDRALTIFQELDLGSTNQANTLRNLGLLYQKRQEFKEARELFEQAKTTLENWQISHNVKHPLTEVIASHLTALTETTDD